MDQQERQHFEQALARKRAEALSRARTGGAASPGAATGARPDAERELHAHEQTQDVPDPRTKNSRHGQVTADKWNQ